MRDFELCKSRDALNEDFSTGKVLPGVIIKSPDCDENIYVCYEERNNSKFMFERVKFNDEKDIQDSIYIMRLFCFQQKNKTVVRCFLWKVGWGT